MKGKYVEQCTFRKANLRATLGSSKSMKINSETVHIDPKLCFEQLITYSKFYDDFSHMISHELMTGISSNVVRGLIHHETCQEACVR